MALKNYSVAKIARICFASSILMSFAYGNAIAQIPGSALKPRIVVTTDPELDDNNSLIRFLLYSSDFEIEGLVYASSQFHWKGDGKGTKWFVPGREYTRFGLDLCPCESWRWPENATFIHDAVEAYANVYPNLKVHNRNYPDPAFLKSRMRYGNIEFDGDISKDSPGSELIKSLILDDKPGKLFLTAWGGQSTIARALKSIQDQNEFTTQWEAIKDKISRKVVILPSGDQDDTYALYIKPNWPDIEYRQFRNGPSYGYGAQLGANEENRKFLTSQWMSENVTGIGPLGALYRVWGDGKQMVNGDKLDFFGESGLTAEELRQKGYVVWLPVQEKGSWLGEGDTFTYMNMLANGLRAWEDASYGGWGGRGFTESSANIFAFQFSDTSAGAMAESFETMAARAGTVATETPFPDFFPAAQSDFAARMKWSVTPSFKNANHEPTVIIEGPLSLLAYPGDKIKIKGKATDPDRDAITVKWRQFMTGSFKGKIEISNSDKLQAELTVPSEAKAGQTIHLVFEATDSGTPSLTRYQRVIVTVGGR